MPSQETTLPFDFTPHIFRYLEQLIEISEKTFAHETHEEVTIFNYEMGEPKGPQIQSNNGRFWNYLETIGAIKIVNKNEFDELKPGVTIEGEIVESGGIKNFYFAKTIVSILDQKKIMGVLLEREKRAVIKPQTLELLAREVAQSKTGPELLKLLKENSIPTKLIVYPDTKWRMLFKVFRILNTSQNNRANKILYKIIEGAVHPLFFNGDEQMAVAVTEKYNKLLKYDRMEIKDGKLYIGPSDEEWGLGLHDWVSSDGVYMQEKTYSVHPTDIAEVWVLWSQIIALTQAYLTDKSLDRKELEKLYLEIIGRAEGLIEDGDVGMFVETYKRPFTSLFTAEVEAKAKKVGSPLDLIGAILLQINEQNPFPNKIAKKMEENSELIDRVNKATKSHAKKQVKQEKMSDVPKGLASGVLKLEITKMPDLNIKNVDENTIVKNKKRIALPKFPPTDWNNVEIRFIDDNTIYMKAGNKTTTGDYESLGFRNDKNGKPDSTWQFLVGLSKNAGETKRIESPIPDKIKGQKRVLSDRLKNIFRNETDPFFDFSSQNNTYKLKIKLTPQIEKEEDKYEVKEYLEKTMTSEYEQEK